MNNSPWFPYLKESINPRVRLLCFHHSGAGASIFRNWLTLFPSSIEIVPVQLPGRESRFNEPFISNINMLVDTLLPLILDFRDAPIALFGHSLGGMLAYIIASKLEEHNFKPSYLFISACLPPVEVKKRKALSELDDVKFLRLIESYNGLPAAITQNKDMLKLLLPRLRSDFKLFESSAEMIIKKISTPTCVCYGAKDNIVPKNKVKGWDNYMVSPCEYEIFKGNHFFYQNTPEQVSETIKNYLVGASVV